MITKLLNLKHIANAIIFQIKLIVQVDRDYLVK